MATFSMILPVLLSLLPLSLSAAYRDTLMLGSSLSIDKGQIDVLRSRDSTFTCGLYNIYDNAFTFSIWYTNSANKTVTWTANRGRPVHARGAAVTLRKGSALVLTDYDGAVVWQAQGKNSAGVQYVQLLDTGNLVMKNSSGMVVWQSFDSPTDTLLPTQLITAATKLVSTTGLQVPGHYTFHFTDSSILSLIYDDADFHEIYWPDPDNGEYQNNRNRYNSTRFGGLDDAGNFFSSDFANQKALVASDQGLGVKRRLTLDPDGNLRLYSLDSSDGRWSVSWVAMSQPCNIHGLCGPNGICRYLPAPTCSCPPGYLMNNPGNWSQGCRPVEDVACSADQVQPVKFLRLPGTDFWGSDQQHVDQVSLQGCKNICRSDCTCKGFQYQQGTGSCYTKAFLFNGKAATAPKKPFRTMYLKLPMSVNISGISIPRIDVLVSREYRPDCRQMSKTPMEPFPDVHKASQGDAKWLYFYGFAGAIFVLEVFFIASAWCFVLRWELGASEIQAVEEGYKVMASNFRRYSYKELAKATRKFKDELGRGGSGIVYKGILDDGRAVAVKMLENIRHCEEEFQAELRVIGRINHMNLVRIWGFCSESSYKMLVTEYIENGSLANILFKDNILLEWKQRFNIALGVAKGLAYLHHECLEWVIHCDVKPENILLDQNLEPKIADFGLAKLLHRGGSNQNVSRVRGTVGYMAPEWISSLHITAKVDVYSYGVVLLELVMGRQVLDLALDADEEVHKVLRELVGRLAQMFDREQSSSINEVVDSRLGGHFNDKQARTLIRLAVSCLDEERSKRPTMESVVQTLLLADESCSGACTESWLTRNVPARIRKELATSFVLLLTSQVLSSSPSSQPQACAPRFLALLLLLRDGGGVGACGHRAPLVLIARCFRVLRVPVGPADGGAAEGDGLLVRAPGRRRLLGDPAGRRLLQPQHRRRPLLLGRQQLLPEQQGQGRHLRLRRRRHHLHHRPKFLRLHFPYQCQLIWGDGHHNRGRRDDGRHPEPRRGHRVQRHEHGDGQQPGTHGHHGRRRRRRPAPRRPAGRLPRRHRPLIPRPAPLAAAPTPLYSVLALSL